MNKTILIIGLLVAVVLAFGAYGAGVAFAQDAQPPMPFGGMHGGQGWMHDYVEQALAVELKITEAQVESALASGKTMVQIALDEGIKEAEIPAFLEKVHDAAFKQAVADGVISQQQADWMRQRMQSRGYGQGTCPMHNGQGFNRPAGMMGGRWAGTSPNSQP